MKKMLALFTALAVFVSTFATTPVAPPVRNAAEVMLPIGKNGEKISVLNLSRISVKDYETVSGNDLNLAQKASFKMAQRQLRQSIAADGTINSKKLQKTFEKMASGDFNLGGFALGFLLGLIGVLIAYIISDDKKKARTKWAWLGFAAAVVFYLILALL